MTIFEGMFTSWFSNLIEGQVFDDMQTLIAYALGGLILLIFVVALCIKKKKKRKAADKTQGQILEEASKQFDSDEDSFFKDEESEEPELDSTLERLNDIKIPEHKAPAPANIIPAEEYVRKCITACAGTDKLPAEIAFDFENKLETFSRDLEIHYKDRTVSWLCSVLPLLARMNLTNNQDIMNGLKAFAMEDFLDRSNINTIISHFTSADEYNNICIWRKMFISAGYEGAIGSFYNSLNIALMGFSTALVVCPDILDDYSSSWIDGDNCVNLVSLLNDTHLGNGLPKLPWTLNYDSGDEPLGQSDEDFYDDVDIEDVVDEESEEDSLSFDEPDEDKEETPDNIYPVFDNIPEDTFTLSVDPELVSDPCEKKGKVFRRIMLPDGNEKKLTDSIIVYEDQIELTEEDFYLLTLPANGNRTIYKSVNVGNEENPVFETKKDIISNADIKQRFGEHYINVLGYRKAYAG